MQTFLPYSDFRKSAEVLDSRRLGKQRIECLQILKALTESNYGWQSHPIVKMWRGYEIELSFYGVTICVEWKNRGYKDSVIEKIYSIGKNKWMDYAIKSVNSYKGIPEIESLTKPSWFGNDAFHLSHQSNLLRKDFNHYSQYFKVPDNLPYQWYNPDTKMFYTTK